VDVEQESSAYEEAAQQTVELGNSIADQEPQADLWDIADGLLAGAIQYWLYSRQPCGDARCEDCEPISTAELRLAELQRLIREMAESSEYYHSVNDANVGRA
jgi:hypothetical protein